MDILAFILLLCRHCEINLREIFVSANSPKITWLFCFLCQPSFIENKYILKLTYEMTFVQSNVWNH